MRWLLAVEEDLPPTGALVLFSLDAPAAEREQLYALLSVEERERAARFAFHDLAARFIIAHGRLRQVLAPQVGMAPQEIEFASRSHGKPYLTGPAADAHIQFNLSHSDGWGLIGWMTDVEIGVDVEKWRGMRDEAALVRRFFSDVEIGAYEALPTHARTEGFFNCWTRKEAYIKAVGRGLGLPLDSFDVSLDSGAGARLLRPSAHCEAGRCWSLAAPDGPPRTSIAVVVESENLVVLQDMHASGHAGCR